MPEASFQERLLAYFTTRQEQRERDIASALPELERQMTEFVAAHTGEAGLPIVLARMIREAAVAAYVRGTMYANPTRVGPPKDDVMLFEAMETIRGNSDLYPAWRIFTSRQLEDDDDDV